MEYELGEIQISCEAKALVFLRQEIPTTKFHSKIIPNGYKIIATVDSEDFGKVCKSTLRKFLAGWNARESLKPEPNVECEAFGNEKLAALTLEAVKSNFPSYTFELRPHVGRGGVSIYAKTEHLRTESLKARLEGAMGGFCNGYKRALTPLYELLNQYDQPIGDEAAQLVGHEVSKILTK